MSEAKTLGQVYADAMADCQLGSWGDKYAAGIAAVCRHVFAEGMAAYLAEHDKPVEPPKPEAASDAGEDYAKSAGRRILGNVDANGVLRLSLGECASIIREAAESERDKIAAELAEVKEACKWHRDGGQVPWLSNGESFLDAILAAFRATKGKEQADAK